MKNKNNIIIIIGIVLIALGAFLPAIRIAAENINFIKENGYLILILVASMGILLKLNYKQLLYIPSILSLIIIFKFIIDNKQRLQQINELYNCYASYKYGLFIMILGNIIILTIITMQLLNIEVLNNKIEQIKESLTKIKNEKLEKPKDEKLETTKDGKIKFNKITVKCNNDVENNKKQLKQELAKKESLKDKIEKLKTKIEIKKYARKKLSISQFSEKRDVVSYKRNIPTIDIQRWTTNDICCTNCGAKVHTTSEYCFLCDCKIKLNQEKEKLS